MLRASTAFGICVLAACLAAAAAESLAADLADLGNASLSLSPSDRQSQSAACRYCMLQCPSLNAAGKRATQCLEARRYLQLLKVKVQQDNHRKFGIYFRFTERQCYGNYCAAISTRDSCGVFRNGRTTQHLRSMLDLQTQIATRARKEWERDIRPKFRFPDYMERRDAIEKHSADLDHVRGLALSAHRDYEKWLRYTWTRHFVMKETEIAKWKEEQNMYAIGVDFWRLLKVRTEIALKTSPLQVRAVAEESRDALYRMLKERKETAARRKNVGLLESDEEWWTQERDVLNERISELDALVDELNNDRRFFHTVGESVRLLVFEIRDDIQRVRVRPGCGSDALAKLISQYTARALITTTSS